MGILDPVGGKKRSRPKNLLGTPCRGTKSKFLKREKPLNKKPIDLKKEFSIIQPQAFIDYCLAVFGLSIQKKTVLSHKTKLWINLDEHWKLKYLSFFYFIKSC